MKSPVIDERPFYGKMQNSQPTATKNLYHATWPPAAGNGTIR
jgi:hypothetical protein